jgi:hypothetical protein
MADHIKWGLMVLATFCLKRTFLTAQALLLLLVAVNANAGGFQCQPVAPDAEGHQPVFRYLSDYQGIEPVELVYCRHEQYPRWVARWSPFEEFMAEGQAWRRYATARCFDQNGDFNCRVTNHVVVGGSHVVVDIKKCDISIDTIAAVHEGVTRDFPGYELKEIEFVIVVDGGAWSPDDYGYKVTLNKPPKFDGGVVRKFVQRCEGGLCTLHDDGGVATWMGGSTELPRLRRARGDPLIEYLEP